MGLCYRGSDFYCVF